MRDVVTGAVVAVIGTFILIEALRLPDAATVTNDPALLPELVGGLLIVCGLIVVGQGWYHLRTGTASSGSGHVPLPDVEALDELEAEGSAEDDSPDYVTTVAMAVTVIVYAALAFRVGYLTTTFVFLVGAPILLSWTPRGRRLLILLGFAVGMVIAIRLVFISALNVPLPETPLP